MEKLIDPICPKCGGDYTTSVYELHGPRYLWKHRCDSCGYGSGGFKTQDKAAEAWEHGRGKFRDERMETDVCPDVTMDCLDHFDVKHDLARQSAIIEAQAELVAALDKRHEALTTALFDEADNGCKDIGPYNTAIDAARQHLEEVQRG